MSFYLYNALGFFLQFFPCALITFLPFSEDTLRIRRKVIFTGLTIASLLLALGFPVVLHGMIVTRGNAAGGVAANIYALLAVLLGLAVFLRLVRETLLKKLLVFFVVLFYGATQYWVVNLYLYLTNFSVTDLVGNYTAGIVLMFIITTAIMLPLMLTMIIRPVGEFIRDIEPGVMRREFSIVILSTLVYIILMFCLSTLWRVNAQRESWGLYSIVFLFLMLNQILIYWLVFRESVRRQKDTERQRSLDIQRLQYEKIAGEMESTSRLRHDLRHHLNALGALNAQGRQDEITEYLKQYGAVYDHLSKQNICEDPVVDSVLEYYLALARTAEANLKCQVSLKGNSGVEPADMTVLLGNCLENALEALRQLPEGQRQLSIEMMTAGAMIVLRIQNTCKGPCDSGEPAGWEAFPSTKGTDHRGVGLRSVTTIAEKYDGSAQFQCKDGVFTTRIILNPTRNDDKQSSGRNRV